MTSTEHINGASVLRFADIEILRYQITNFEELPLERKLLVYHLSEAALSGRDIIFDQHGRYNLRLRAIFEAIYEYYDGDRESEDFTALTEYLYRLWFSSGIHHHYGSEKFTPAFREDFFREAIRSIQYQKARLLEFNEAEINELCLELFDPTRSSKRTVQSGDEDLIEASAVNFYAPEISQTEVEQWYQRLTSEASAEEQAAPPSYGLNSRLARAIDGTLYEQTYRIGGLYGAALERVSTHLKAALAYTDTEAQRAGLLALLDYYKTGDLNAYNRFCILWVQDTDVEVDFINGFTETYSDPLGMKGSWESLVHIRHQEATERTKRICQEAGWFERHAPIDEAFKKENPTGVSASVVTVAMLAGDSYPATPIGINLPNADWIRADYGSKSVTIDNIHSAYHYASRHNGMDEAFVPDPAVRDLLNKYEGYTEQLHTDLHECLGHGSGKLAPGVSPDALGAYGSTIEEARADLFALYYMADAKLLELGLLPDAEAYKACYYRYLLNGLITQLVRIRLGHNIEEAHMRNRALIARYVLARAAEDKHIELRGIELVINDYEAARRSIAALLREVQRIKSEGDYEAARALVEGYGVHVFPEQHEEILARYSQLNIAPYRGFVNPRLELVFEDGGIVDVIADYTEGYAEQMLRYSKTYGTLSLNPSERQYMLQPMPSVQTLETAKYLRGRLREGMDGVVSSSMRDKGLHYGINFGFTQEHIRRLAESLPHDLDLATYLMSRDVRELKLIAQQIFPSEAMTFERVTYLGSVCYSNPELRDCLAKSLLDRCADAPQWALAWLLEEGEEPSWADLRPLGYITLARHITRGYILSQEVWHQQLLSRALGSLRGNEDEGMSTEREAALLLLKRWGRTDQAVRKEVLHFLEVEGWVESADPLEREYADALHFEYEY